MLLPSLGSTCEMKDQKKPDLHCSAPPAAGNAKNEAPIGANGSEMLEGLQACPLDCLRWTASAALVLNWSSFQLLGAVKASVLSRCREDNVTAWSTAVLHSIKTDEESEEQEEEEEACSAGRHLHCLINYSRLLLQFIRVMLSCLLSLSLWSALCFFSLLFS